MEDSESSKHDDRMGQLKNLKAENWDLLVKQRQEQAKWEMANSDLIRRIQENEAKIFELEKLAELV